MILLLLAVLIPLSGPGGGAAQALAPVQVQPAPAATDPWETYHSVRFGYSIDYPAEWKAQVVFENPAGEAHVIRQRVAFRSAQQAQVEIDVWDRDPSMPMDQWFREVENITTTVEINSVISGQDAYLRVEPGDCGVPTVYAAYVPFGDYVYKIAHPNSGDLASLAAYDEMLRSFALWAVDPEARSQVSLPDYLPRAPLVCSTNVCPSTCWGECTFAAVSEGCCGYHAVPRWQCAKECIGSLPGDFQGNCVWWAAYARPDVGALASGNAENWAVSVKNTGQLPVDRTPKVGDTVVHPGSSYNHVAYVVWVSADRTSYMMSDMGWCGDCGPTPEETKLRTVDADDEFIHCKGDPAIPEVDWQFADCPFGWTPSKGFSASQMDGSAWGFNPAVDPFLLSPILSVPASEYNNVEVRLFSHAADTVGTIYFATASSPGFDGSKSVEFAVTNDGAWHDIVVDMSTNPNWQGTITRLRVDPMGNGNADGSYDGMGIDRIRFLLIDITPPGLASNVRPDGWQGPYTGDINPRFRWDPASDDPGGRGMAGYYVAVDDWTPEGSCMADWWAGDVTSFAPPLDVAQGEHIVAVTSEDLAGNINPADTDLPGDAPYYTFTLDLSGPSAPEIALSGPGCDGIQNNGWQNTCNDPAFSWSAGDTLSGLKDYVLYWGDQSDGAPDTQTGDTALDPGPIAPADGAASAYLHLVARDMLDHASGRSTFALRYDGAAPTAEFTIDGGASSTHQLQVTVTLSAQDTGSGVADYRLSNDGADWTAWLPWDGEPAGTLELPWELPQVDGEEHTVHAQVRDRAGNESAVATDSIWLDLYGQMPHSDSYLVCADVLDAGGSAALTSASYSLTSAIGQAVSTGAESGTSASFSLAGGFLSGSGGCAPVMPDAAAASAGSLLSGVTYLLGNAASDLASEPQAPDFGISINGGDPITQVRAVTVEPRAPHVSQVRLSNDDGYLDAGYLDEGWMAYGGAMPWTLAASGSPVMPRRVHAWFRNEEGLVYGPYFDEILYDGTPPRGGVVIDDSDPPTTTLKLGAWDGISGVDQMRVGEDPALAGASWQPYTTTLTWESGSPIAYAQYSDLASNISRIYSSEEGLCPGENTYLPLVLRNAGPSGTNQPPHEPADPWPADGAVDQLPPLTLSWTGGDPDGDAVTYDVYLNAGTAAPQTRVCDDVASPACDPGTLLPDTEYSWQVVASDQHGASTSGPVWSLRTAAAGCVEVVVNGSFEIDNAWEIPGTAYPARYSTAQARYGSRSIQVGIVETAEDEYSYSSTQQSISIPAGEVSASLRFWLYTVSDEPEIRASLPIPSFAPQAMLAEDAQYVLLFDEANARKTLWSRRLDDRSWVQYGSFNLSAYAGQTVRLYFGVFNDGDGAATGMYVDEVSLVVCPP